MHRPGLLTKGLLVVVLSAVASGCFHGATARPPFSMTLKILQPFDPPVVYEVIEGDPCRLIHKAPPQSSGQKEGEHVSRVFEVSPRACAAIRERTRATLETAPPELDLLGFDGSLWVLSSNLREGYEVDAWEPGYKADRRGYTDLLQLRRLLHRIIEGRPADSGGGQGGTRPPPGAPVSMLNGP